MGLGQTADGFISDVEILDVFDPTMSCNLSNFPYSAAGAFGLSGGAIFCGGHNSTDYSNECYYSEDGKAWIKAPDMQQKR